jgi:hypothetical protein
MSVRGVITSPARVSPNSMMDWMSSPSSSSRMPSSSPTSMSAWMSPPLSSSSDSSESAPFCVTCGSPPRRDERSAATCRGVATSESTP